LNAHQNLEKNSLKTDWIVWLNNFQNNSDLSLPKGIFISELPNILFQKNYLTLLENEWQNVSVFLFVCFLESKLEGKKCL
jgi:hypothetical protein